MLNHTEIVWLPNTDFFFFFNQERCIENIKQINTVNGLASGTAGRVMVLSCCAWIGFIVLE